MKKLVLWTVVMSICVLLSVQPSHAAVYYVEQNGIGDGTSQPNAMGNDSFALALYNANEGDIFILGNGIYKPIYDVNGKIPTNKRLATFYVRKRLTIKSFSGTTLSGNIGDLTKSTDNCYHVITIADNLPPSTDYILDNITVTDGYANGGGIYSWGAGIYIGKSACGKFNSINVTKNYGVSHGIGVYAADNTNVLFDNSKFIENTRVGGDVWGGGFSAWTGARVEMKSPLFENNIANHGGAFHTHTSTVVLRDAIFKNNQATVGHGGAIDNYLRSTLAINNSYFEENTSGSWGGAIHNEASSILLIDSSKIINNKGTHGGGFHNTSSTATIKNTTIQGNLATAGHGGGIDNYSGSKLTMTNVEIVNNQSTSWGGGVHNEASSNIFFRKGSIKGNISADHGGGFHNTSSNAEFYSIIVENNKAKVHGGGANIYGGTTIMDSCTFRYNMVTNGDGGGIHHEAGGLTLRRTEVAFNEAAKGQGGGLVVVAEPFRMTNTTVSGNTALSYGAGVSLHVSATLINNTIVNNKLIGNSAAYTGGGIFSGIHPFLTNTLVSGNTKGGVPNDISSANLTVDRTSNNIIGSDYYPSGSKTPLPGAKFSIIQNLDTLDYNGFVNRTHKLIGDYNPAYTLGKSSVLSDSDTTLRYDQRTVRRLAPPSIGAYEGKGGMVANVDYEIFTEVGSSITVNVLTNDYLSDCTDYEIELVAPNPFQGSVTLIAGNQLLYTPNLNFTGMDSIGYRIKCKSSSPIKYSNETRVYISLNNYPDNVIDACVGVAPSSPWGIRQYYRSDEVVFDQSIPLVGNIDNKEGIEIVVAGAPINPTADAVNSLRCNTLKIFDAKNKQWIKTLNVIPFHAGFGTFAMADVNGDKLAEFFVASCDLAPTADQGYIFSYNSDGSLRWKSKQRYTYSKDGSFDKKYQYPYLIIADFNGDGVPEILANDRIFNAQTGELLLDCGLIASQSGKDPLDYGSNAGHLAWPEKISRGVFPCVSDMDKDGKLELVAGSNIYKINIADLNSTNGNTCTVFKRMLSGIAAPTDGHTVVADINLDGYLDVIVNSIVLDRQGGSYTSAIKTRMYAWDGRTGDLIGQTGELTSYIGTSIPFVGNLIDDTSHSHPNPEIAFTTCTKLDQAATTNALINVYKYDKLKPVGSQLVKAWTKDVKDVSGSTTLTLFDFNQDGQCELVYRDEAKIRILEGLTGTEKIAFPCGSYTLNEYPVVADVTGDGRANIVVLGNDIPSKPVGKEVFNRGGLGRLFIFEHDPAVGTWAPARPVWNQWAYNSVNVNQNLTIPKRQFNPATVFPGKDEILGTSDDVRPFNGFLMQQTDLGVNGEPLWLLPNIQWVDSPSFRYYAQGDSLSVTLRVTNLGDAATTAPLYISCYIDTTARNKLIKTISYDGVINPGQEVAFSFRIEQASTKLDSSLDGDLLIRLNDNDANYPVQEVCEESGTLHARPIISLLRTQSDYYMVFSNIPADLNVLLNDRLGLCPLAKPKVVGNPKHGTYIIDDNMIRYTSGLDYNGLDTLRYRVVCDRDSSEAYVYLKVVKINVREYTACPESKVKLQVEAVDGVTFRWYDSEFDPTIKSTGLEYDVVKDYMPEQVFWLEPEYNSTRYARIPVVLTLETNCGNTPPSDCAVDGTLIWKEDFDSYGNGLNPSSGVFSTEALPFGRTSYPFWDGSGKHPTDNSSNAIYPLDGEYVLMKNNGPLSSWYFYDDHTSPNNPSVGRVMVVNAQHDPKSNSGLFYSHTIEDLCSDVTLYFSTWIANVTTGSNYEFPNLRFVLTNPATGQVLKEYYTGNIPIDLSIPNRTDWRNYGFSFDVPAGLTSLKMDIFDNAVGGSGNDFILDDLEVRFCVPAVIIRPDEDTIACLNSSVDLKLFDNYDGSNSFGQKLEYRWEFKASKNDSWSIVSFGNSDNGKVSEIQSKYTINPITTFDAGYYRFLIASEGSLNNIHCRAVSDSFFLKVPVKLVVPDVRVQLCPDSTLGASFNLSSYLHPSDEDFNWEVAWGKVTAYSPMINSTTGEVDLNFDKGIHIYKYKLAHQCGADSARFYITTLFDKPIQMPPYRVVVCKDRAEHLSINQIMGLEAGGDLISDLTALQAANHITKVSSPSLFAGAVLFNGKSAWSDSTTTKINYQGDTSATRVTFKYTAAQSSCLANKEYTLEIIITENIIN